MPAKPNFASETIWTSDNLPILRGMNSACVDLIYLDPPFNSKANYAAPIGSKAAGAAFKDTWGLSDISLAWHGEIKHDYPGLYDLLNATRTIHGDSMMSYLIYMAIRIMELRRVLKDTGSVYLHCDTHAGHYLKLMMDSVFGWRRFRNEITWKRNASHNDSKGFGRIADTIFFYGSNINKDAVLVPHDPEYIEKNFRYKDERGPYSADNLSAKGKTGGGYYYDFHGHKGPWLYPEASMKKLEDAGRIHLPKKIGGVPRRKIYLHESRGKAPSCIWTDISPIRGASKEKTNYPTQKPLALLRRIIRASSNKDDVVLDPFCGCATACIAAQMEGRKWVGIDISPKAADLVKDRMKNELGLFYKGKHRTDVPERTDLGKIKRYNHPDNIISLYGKQGGYCNGCGTHFERRHLTVDHIIPRDGGGTDHISNLQLLCANCNSIKGARSQDYLMARLLDKGFIKRGRPDKSGG